jgi:hypothetical protein
MPGDGWIRFEGYEGRLDPQYGGGYASPGLKFPFVERNRTWDIARVDGEPVGDVYRRGQFTVLSRGYDMMKKAHEEAAAYRLHFKRCTGVGNCNDIGHPGGPRRSMAQGIRPAPASLRPDELATPDGGDARDARPPVPPAVQRSTEPTAAEDWTVGLHPMGEIHRRSVASGLDLLVIPILLDLWQGPKLHMQEDCNKRGGRVVGDEGELSCAEVEIVKRLRRVGWDAAWVQAFKCGRRRWSAYIQDVPDFPDAVGRVQAGAGSARGHPDVLAWKGDRVVAIESKGPGDRLKPSQIEWFLRALKAGVAPRDVAMVEWRVRR